MNFRDPDGSISLCNRPEGAVLFRRPGGDVTVAAFLRDVWACAVSLPEAAYAVNLCQDRYWFAVAFAAALWRGQITLLHGDRSARGLGALAARFAGMQMLVDDPAFATSLPHCTIGRQHAVCTAPHTAMPHIRASRRKHIWEFV